MFLYDVGYTPTSPRMTEARRQPRTLNEIRATMSRWVRLRNILPLSRYAILFTTSDESFFVLHASSDPNDPIQPPAVSMALDDAGLRGCIPPGKKGS